MFFTYVSEKMSHLYIYLQLDAFSNFYFTFDIFEIFFGPLFVAWSCLKTDKFVGLVFLPIDDRHIFYTVQNFHNQHYFES